MVGRPMTFPRGGGLGPESEAKNLSGDRSFSSLFLRLIKGGGGRNSSWKTRCLWCKKGHFIGALAVELSHLCETFIP
ncbi:hypothetical protein F0562_026783 [Nyssa sinensis]|uniref:Uncharacterized protein n=1 Tax=Nyssa sinensis TaxID=561372 RepID=A0A5J5BG03_9ASTE|nr:hypothetical protein F0562_026783 [Nyssa sinensis]